MIVEHLQKCFSIPSSWRSGRTHVVALGLEPVQRLLSTLVALAKITSTPLGNLWFGNGGVGSRAGDLASEAVHVHCEPDERWSCTTLENSLTLRGAAVDGMDPMPCTDTATLGAGRHVLGNLEGSVDAPNTVVIDTEDRQILGLDAVHIGSVRDGEGTTLHVFMRLRGDELAAPYHRSCANAHSS